MQELVFPTEAGNAATDTLRVAAAFEKQHEDVLRIYDELKLLPAIRSCHFGEGFYTDERNERRRSVLMTCTGFKSLVNGFSGKNYAHIKRMFLAEFERLEAQLCGYVQPLQALPLLGLTTRTKQVEAETGLAEHLLEHPAGAKGLAAYHNNIMRCLTGKTASEYVQAGVFAGICPPSTSGRELLRQLEPAKAATAAWMDDQMRRGRSLPQMTKAGVHKYLPLAFEAMLRAGIAPAELQLESHSTLGGWPRLNA
jgi:Rha family phage regulatory protein